MLVPCDGEEALGFVTELSESEFSTLNEFEYFHDALPITVYE